MLDSRPTLVVDDGADLTATIHTGRRDLLAGVAGATEVTSTGVLRARNMAREGACCSTPLLAVNDAATKHLFDNRYGTGQSTIDGILRATNVLLAGKVAGGGSATAGAAGGWPPGPAASAPGWWCARSTRSRPSRR